MAKPFARPEKEKIYQLKTKLKAAECAAHLQQFAGENAASTKPLSGWVANQSFELAPTHAGLFTIQSRGNIRESAEGSVVIFEMHMSSKTRMLLTISACLILGALAALVPSYFSSQDLFGTIWTTLVLVVIPALIWCIVFIAIRRIIENKKQPFINTVCSTLSAVPVSTGLASTAPPIIINRPAKNTTSNFSARKLSPVISVALHLVPFLVGAGAADQATNYLHNRAWDSWVGGNYAESEAFCLPIMQITELCFARDAERLSHAYYILAENYRCQGKLDEALKYYTKAKNLQETIYSRKSPIMAWTYDNIGRVYDAQGSPAAVDYYNQAISAWKSDNSNNQEALIARTLNRLALFHAKQKSDGQAELAEEEQQDAINRDRLIHPGVPKTMNMTYAQDLNDMAVIFMSQRKFPEARKALEEAISIKEKLIDQSKENDLHLAISYSNFGWLIRRDTGDDVDSTKYLLKASQLYNKWLPDRKTFESDYGYRRAIENALLPSYEFPNCYSRVDTSVERIELTAPVGDDEYSDH